MPAEEEFSFPQDYEFFGIMVGNKFCTAADLGAFARWQRAQPATRLLVRLLAPDVQVADMWEDFLQSSSSSKARKQIRSNFPGIDAAVEEIRAKFGTPENKRQPQKTAFHAGEELENKLRPLIEELRDKRMALGERDRVVESWAESAIQFLEAVEAAESNPDLAAPHREAAARFRKHFERTHASLGFIVVAPAPGDPFDDRQHIFAESENGPPGTPPGTITRCLQWGYCVGGGRLVKARVAVTPLANSAKESSND